VRLAAKLTGWRIDIQSCCKTHAVPEIGKPQGEWCIHSVDCNGCSVYPHHPPACQEFKCAWLKGLVGTDDERPDKVRYVCTTLDITLRGRTRTVCTMMEVSVGVFKRSAALSRTQQMRDAGWIVEWWSLVPYRRTLILPKGVEKSEVPQIEAELWRVGAVKSDLSELIKK
jgi:hypothetical protein